MNTPTKPPIGLIPKWYRQEQRLAELAEAVTRYTDANEAVPTTWLIEMQEVTSYLIKYRMGGGKRGALKG